MATMGIQSIHSWKWQSVASPRCILQPQFVSPVVSATTKPVGPISTSSAPDSLSSLTNFLVGSLGFSENQALSASSKLNKFRQSQGAKTVCGTNFLSNADSVVSFLEQKGLDKPRIRNLVTSVPQILTCRIEHNLEPKITFFQQLGLSVSELADLLSTQPGILSISLDSTIRPAIEALRAIMGSNHDVVRVIKKFKWNNLQLVTKCVVWNVSSLRAQGIALESIKKRMLVNISPFVRNPEVFKEIMAQAEEKWGVSPSSSQFLHAVHVLSCLNEKTIESKCRVFESFGFKRSDVVDMFRRNPYSLVASEDMIRAKLSFFVNDLGYDPLYVATKPQLMTYSLKKRVLPRHLVLQLLKEKGLIGKKFSLYTVVSLTEPHFLKRLIQPYENDVPNLRKIYTDSLDQFASEQIESGKNIHFTDIKLQADSAGE